MELGEGGQPPIEWFVEGVHVHDPKRGIMITVGYSPAFKEELGDDGWEDLENWLMGGRNGGEVADGVGARVRAVTGFEPGELEERRRQLEKVAGGVMYGKLPRREIWDRKEGVRTGDDGN
jgi:hypothetical protein